MRVWEMRSNDNAEARITPIESDREWDVDYDNTFDGRPKLGSWEPWSLKKAYGSKRLPLGEISCFVPGDQFVLSEYAVDALYDLIEGDVELLPMRFEGEMRWLMYVTAVLDCVDYERSEYSVLPSGRVLCFDAVMLNEDGIGGHNVFKLKDSPCGFVLVSDAFRGRAMEVDPKGPEFFLVWDSARKDPIRLPFGYLL